MFWECSDSSQSCGVTGVLRPMRYVSAIYFLSFLFSAALMDFHGIFISITPVVSTVKMRKPLGTSYHQTSLRSSFILCGANRKSLFANYSSRRMACQNSLIIRYGVGGVDDVISGLFPLVFTPFIQMISVFKCIYNLCLPKKI